MSCRAPSCRLALAALVALAIACPGEKKEDRTSTAVEGEWRSSQLRAGTSVAAGTFPGWARVHFDVDAAGAVTIRETLDSLGDTTPGTAPIRFSTDDQGGVSSVEGPWTGYAGQLDPSGELWVASCTGGGASQLRINQRVVPGKTFAQTDLAGLWHYHAFTTGALIRTEHGHATTEAGGTTTLTERVSSSDGPLDDVDLGVLALDGLGLVTLEGDPAWKGVLSADGDLLVATHTLPFSGPAHELILVVRDRRDLGTPGLAGTWRVFMLDQDAGGGGWSRVTASISASGVVTLSGYEDDVGGTLPAEPITLSVAVDGTITQAGNPSWHGVLAPGLNLFVAVTVRDEGAQASVYVGVRLP